MDFGATSSLEQPGRGPGLEDDARRRVEAHRVTTISSAARTSAPGRRLIFPGGGITFHFFASIDLFLMFQFLDHLVQRVRACGPKPDVSVRLDPLGRLLPAPVGAGRACRSSRGRPFRGNQPGLLQDADVLLHARCGVMWNFLSASLRDRSVRNVRKAAPERYAGWRPKARRTRRRCGRYILEPFGSVLAHVSATCKGGNGLSTNFRREGGNMGRVCVPAFR